MRIQAILIVSILLVFLTSCSNATDMREERESTLSKQKGDILVGVAWPFADRNEGFREGLELALGEINKKGVLGSKIRLVEKDDKSSVTDGLTIAQSFANDPELTAVIGHRSSVVTVPAAKVYDHAGLPLIAPSSTAPGLTAAGLDRVFRTIPDDTRLGKTMADYANAKHYKRVAIFYTNDEYGRGLANAFEDGAKAAGMQTIDRLSDYKDLNDLRRIADKWKLLGCDAVFLAEVMPDGAAFVADLRKAGLEVPVIGGDGLDSAALPAAAGGAAEGMVVASIFNPFAADDTAQAFVKQYESTYNAEPGKLAAQGYDALKLLAYALDKAGTREPSKLAKTLKETKGWQGASGLHTFDDNGDVSDMPIVLKQVEGGTFHYLN
ncbi:ABC transporter substrate-binding protein [Paenibacillus rhizovicinus]|uniref:ABC transporter substrate-binding protein n=1 Tax=Paenibacillus rhizovicinus TaxID=2704463 RepID=A0A6C0P1H4_9BACL|nr:ABC transporter substrate-binding protein [Paenibacillus rhizovicinus]QHW32309.1 ABC transporter substrate-binding protein [Paenibacillus rhizovicinus]